MKNIVVVEFNNYHQETVFAWVYILIARLQHNVTVFSPDRCEAVEYCSKMLSHNDKERLAWRSEKDIVNPEASQELQSADCVIFNTFYTTSTVFETQQRPLLQWCENERKKVIMYVHRPENLFESPAATFLSDDACLLAPTLLFSCKHGLEWYERQTDKNDNERCKRIRRLQRNWMFPAHMCPAQPTSQPDVDLLQYKSDFALVGGMVTARRDYPRALKIAKETAKVSSNANAHRLLVAGKDLGYPTVAVRRQLKVRNTTAPKICRIVTDPSYETLFDIVAQTKVLLTCCRNERYFTNALSGSVLMAVAAGIPFTSTSELRDAYASAFKNNFFLDERNMGAVTDRDVADMHVRVAKIRTEMIERNTALLENYLTD